MAGERYHMTVLVKHGPCTRTIRLGQFEEVLESQLYPLPTRHTSHTHARSHTHAHTRTLTLTRSVRCVCGQVPAAHGKHDVASLTAVPGEPRGRPTAVVSCSDTETNLGLWYTGTGKLAERINR